MVKRPAWDGLLGVEGVFLALLLLVPASVLAHALAPGRAGLVFVLSCAALVPLARYMGQATEVLAHRLGSGLGGLLNATFGNAAELILAFAALRAGQVEVVKASITGSILGNLLLIMGAALFAGGLGRARQRFSATAALTGSSMMFLALVALAVPSLFHAMRGEAAAPLLPKLSLGIAAIMLVVYAMGLLFTLKTHAHLYTDEEEVVEDAPYGVRVAAGVLLAATAATAWVSELLVSSLEHAIASFGFTRTFVGVMLLAVVGNAAEHSTAVLMAVKDRIGLAFHISYESSKQIALFVAPVLVLAGWLMGRPMDLEFSLLEVAGIGIGVGAGALIAIDGESNWLEGAMLLAVYSILGIAFFFVP